MLRKKGWGEVKIARWLIERDKKKSQDSRQQIQCGMIPPDHENNPDRWREILIALRTRLKLKYIGILLHWYCGDLDTEELNIERREVPQNSDLGQTLNHMKEDTLYVVR